MGINTRSSSWYTDSGETRPESRGSCAPSQRRCRTSAACSSCRTAPCWASAAARSSAPTFGYCCDRRHFSRPKCWSQFPAATCCPGSGGSGTSCSRSAAGCRQRCRAAHRRAWMRRPNCPCIRCTCFRAPSRTGFAACSRKRQPPCPGAPRSGGSCPPTPAWSP